MLPVEPAVLFQLELFCLLFFVAGGGVVPPLAFGALKDHYVSHGCFSLYLNGPFRKRALQVIRGSR
jgi:hypothetical protein